MNSLFLAIALVLPPTTTTLAKMPNPQQSAELSEPFPQFQNHADTAAIHAHPGFAEFTTADTPDLSLDKYHLLDHSTQVQSMTFTVVSTADTGVGTLRDAITRANANPGFDTILFSIGSGPKTITVFTNLPTLNGPTLLDGRSQPGYSGRPLVELVGGTASLARGIGLAGGYSVVQGFVINRFNEGIVSTTTGFNTIKGNYIGTDITGTQKRPNRSDGIWLITSDNVIGGSLSEDANVISGNGASGIVLRASEFYAGDRMGARNTIINNKIGTDWTGALALGNSGDGVLLNGSGSIGGASANTIGGTTSNSRNTISGNALSGINLNGPDTNDNMILGNNIGTDYAGVQALGNTFYGIYLWSSAHNNTIGGNALGAPNIISANGQHGITLNGGNVSNNRILGNIIGLTATQAPLGNIEAGIRIRGGAFGNTIGGLAAADGNVLGANKYGVRLSEQAHHNVIIRNAIGTRLDGSGAVGNSRFGVWLEDASDNIIGTLGSGNVIAYNDKGIVLKATNPSLIGRRNSWRGNACYNNNSMEIDIGDDGVSLNDAQDVDAGPNDQINYPLAAVVRARGATVLKIWVNGTPFTYISIDVYYGDSCTPLGQASAQFYLATVDVTTDSHGYASYTLPTTAHNAFALCATAGISGSSELTRCGRIAAEHISLVPSRDGRLLYYEGDAAMPRINVCADGTPSTRITFNTFGLSNPSGINATLSWDVEGNEPGRCGRVDRQEASGSTAAFILTHPDGPVVQDDYSVILTDEDGQPLADIPVRWHRPPVLMVHGLWSAGSTWDAMQRAFVGTRTPVTLAISYHGDLHFESNRDVVERGIQALLDSTVSGAYSAEKVDVVGHSMGGVLARKYLQSESYANDMFRVITLTSPHAGSQVPNLLYDEPGMLVLREVLRIASKNPYRGAIEDLRVNSAATAALNGPSLNRNTVPSHVVVSTVGALEGNGWLGTVWRFTLWILGAGAAECVFQGEDSDLLVPLSSQRGGVALSATSEFAGPIHTEATAAPAIVDEVKRLLRTSSTGAEWLSGFQPSVLSYVSCSPLRGASAKGDQAIASVSIVSPPTGAVCVPGQSVNVSVSSTGPISSLFVGAAHGGGAWCDTVIDAGAGQVPLVVPIDAIGSITLFVIGRDGSGAMAFDTVEVEVQIAALLDSIVAFPAFIGCAVGDSAQVSLLGYYDDGLVRDISYLPGLTYSVADPAVAELVQQAIVVATSVGETAVTASVNGRSAVIPLRSVNRTDWQSVDVAYGSVDKREPEEIVLVTPWPNPARNSPVHIRFTLPRRSHASVSILDVSGRIVRRIASDDLVLGTHQFVWDLRRANGARVAPGLYFCDVRGGSMRAVQKFVLMP